MFSKVIAWFKGEVQSVEGILAGFHKTVTALENHAAGQYEQAAVHTTKQFAHEAAAVKAEAEAKKAEAVAGQIKALVTVTQ